MGDKVKDAISGVKFKPDVQPLIRTSVEKSARRIWSSIHEYAMGHSLESERWTAIIAREIMAAVKPIARDNNEKDKQILELKRDNRGLKRELRKAESHEV